jgi:CheY-like chemotaxis protein
MTNFQNNRRGEDRRSVPRGGRRTGDVDGLAPLVLLLGRGETVVSQAETVLARLKFAVTTTGTVPEALRIMESIRPDVVVADPEAALRLRLESFEDAPIVEMNGDMRDDPDALVDAIRQALRASQFAG